MEIRHSQLFNEFTSFWFETTVDGQIAFDTHLNFQENSWTTCRHLKHGILLKGAWPSGLLHHQIVRRITPKLEEAIKNGLI